MVYATFLVAVGDRPTSIRCLCADVMALSMDARGLAGEGERRRLVPILVLFYGVKKKRNVLRNHKSRNKNICMLYYNSMQNRMVVIFLVVMVVAALCLLRRSSTEDREDTYYEYDYFYQDRLLHLAEETYVHGGYTPAWWRRDVYDPVFKQKTHRQLTGDEFNNLLKRITTRNYKKPTGPQKMMKWNVTYVSVFDTEFSSPPQWRWVPIMRKKTDKWRVWKYNKSAKDNYVYDNSKILV